MYKIGKKLLFYCVVISVLITNDAFAACTTDCCKKCDEVDYYCRLGCGGVQGCLTGCGFNKLLCQSACSTNYYIRNASTSTLNFFKSDGTKIDTLGPLDIRTFYPKESDFPITVTECASLNTKGCDHKYVIQEKGCYFAWYERATSFLCFTSKTPPISSLPKKGNVKSPPPPSSKGKRTSPQGEQKPAG